MMENKNTTRVLFADPNTGICYKYPENKGDKPYVSYEEIAAYISARGEYMMNKAKEFSGGSDSASDDSKKATLILASAFEELRHFFNDVTAWVKEATDAEDD